MRNYSVLLQGSGCRVKIDSRAHPELTTLERVGFFTTRFVRAPSLRAAVDRARELVDEELAPLLLNRSAEPVSITVVEVRENPESFDEYAPGRGFTWYTDSLEDDSEFVQ